MIPPDYKALETRIAEIKARAERATEGPWALFRAESISIETTDGGYVVVDQAFAEEDEDAPEREHDALFIAHAREDIPFLLTQLQRLQDEIERLKGYVTHKPECLAGDPRGVIPCVRGLLPETGAI